MEKDYYKILEVTDKADDETIKKSFRRLAKKYHPDTNNGDPHAAKLFQEINEAYAVLGDAAKRKTYDEERIARQAGGSSKNEKAQNSGNKGNNPFAGLNPQNFKMDFGDMMFEELNGNKSKQTDKKQQVDFADVSNQFASFFGFRPK